MTWNLIKLIDICNPKQWKTLSFSEMLPSGYPVYGANGKVGFYYKYTHSKPTVLITCRGATCGEINICDPMSYVNGNAMALDNLIENVDIHFLSHYLKQRGFEDVISGSAQPQITRQGLSKITIPIPPLQEQQRIATVLDHADSIRHKNRQILEKYNELAQSVFNEMFGDPVNNPNGFKTVYLNESITDVTNGISRRRKTEKNLGSIVLRLRDIRENYVAYSDVNRIDLNISEQKKYLINPGDLLFIRVNGNPDFVGRCAVFKGFNEPVFFNDHIMRVRVENDFNPIFLSHFLNSSHGKLEIKKHLKTSAGQHTISQEGLMKISLYKPQINLQNHFAEIIEKINIQKIGTQKSLEKSEELFQSLLQRAFKGEL